MSKAKQAGDAPEDKPRVVSTLVDAEKFNRIFEECLRLAAQAAEASGDLGNAIKVAGESHKVHRGAFKLVMKLERMEDTKRNEFLRHLDEYIMIRGLDRQPDLFEAKPDGDKPDGGGPNGGAEKPDGAPVH